MQVNAKVDYALRALTELANVAPGPMKAEAIARACAAEGFDIQPNTFVAD